MASQWRGLRGGFARACGQGGNQACTLLRKRTNPGRSRPVRGIRARAQEAKHADSNASNGAHQTEARVRSGARTGTVERKTKETDIFVRIDVDGVGKCDTDTGIPFLEHMLHQIASHGLFDIEVKAKGDIWIDDHHTTEDIALAFGQCLSQALGNRSGINRFGDFTAPLDEALIHVVMDLSGRPHVSCDLDIPAQRVGTFDTELVEHFFQSLSNTSGMTLHIRQLAGVNSHHIIESTFKAFARALRRACEYDERLGAGAVASSKGVLTQK